MESEALRMDANTAADPRVHSNCNIAYLRRRAWAQSKESVWQEPEPEHCGNQGPQKNDEDGETQRPSEEPGQHPNNITNWLIECRTPLGSSLDDQSASPNRGALRNGCSFEDDLSLGAEANHLQSNNKTQSCVGLMADQKRSRFKEGARSMNSTGSGKSSTVSSVSKVSKQSEESPEEIFLNLRVSELLDLYEEDPEEVLLNLGFGREEPDPAARVPSRFINNASSARGIDMKVYLGAQLQRMELENPNYALTSRFRQIEVLTTVANEFFQLYSQVSGQPVQPIKKDQGGERGDEQSPALKRNSSALNVAKLLKTISKRNLLPAASESPEANVPKQHTELNGHASPVHTNTSSPSHTGTEPDSGSTDPDHQEEPVNQKHVRKKENCSLATVTEEIIVDGEAEISPEQSKASPAANGEHQPELGDLQPANQGGEEETQVVKEEEDEEKKKLISTPDRIPCTLVPLQLSQLRSKNTDSFDMEEIQSNEDEALPHRTSRTTDLSRTVSQQSDSSGFAEEPSVDSNSYLKVQESSDSCDSETTVTSHPSQDVATPLALEQPAFDLPDAPEKEVVPDDSAEAHGSSWKEEEYDQDSEQLPLYTAHHLPVKSPNEMQDESQDDDLLKSGTDAEQVPCITQNISFTEQEPQLEVQPMCNQLSLKQEQKPLHDQSETPSGTQEECAFSDDSGSSYHPISSSPVLSALKRAQQNQLSRAGQWVEHKSSNATQNPERGPGRGRGIPLQRSSSLPSSILSPTRVVSSVRIQFKQGQTSCTHPRYSFRYTQDAGVGKENEEQEKEGQDGSSKLVSNPVLSSGSKNQPKLPTESLVPPKPLPRYLLRSSYSLQSSSPPPDLLPGCQSPFWTTQSVPDLSSTQQPHGQFQNQQSWNPGQMTFPSYNPIPYPNSQNVNPSPIPSPYPMILNSPLQYPTPLQPYASLPNLSHSNNLSTIHNCSLSSLHQPVTPTIPQHNSLSNLHQPSASAMPHPVGLGNLRMGPSAIHHHSYNHLYSQQPSYHSSPHGSMCASPYLSFQGHNMNTNLGFPHPFVQYPPLTPEPMLPPGLAPHPPGFLPGLASSSSPGSSVQSYHTPPPLSSTERQLRKVLHDIRTTLQSLGQDQADTLNAFLEHRASTSHQPLEEFQQKRRSLNMFRSQMVDLEMSFIQQQALVYKHLSPAERLEVTQLQSLRAAVREELQELEQQLDDKMLELTHQTKYGDLHRANSIDSLSTASALRAIEPVSDLLREQCCLQSEIDYAGQVSPSRSSSTSSSPGRREGRDNEQRPGTYRASINITPTVPSRLKANAEDRQREEDGKMDGGGVKIPEAEPSVGGVQVDSVQQLINQMRASMAQEIRQEIFRELLATVAPQHSTLPSRQHPL